MTSTAKSGITANTAGLIDLTTAEAADVLNPLTDLLNAIKSGRVSVTANDTHVKHLDDAITVGAGLSKSVTSPGGSEGLQISGVVMTGDAGAGGTAGLVPAPSSGDAAALKFLCADGTWRVP